MEKCFRCEKSEEEVQLVDAIYENEVVKVCEKCSITEKIPLIKKPSIEQLKESEKSFNVYQRMRKMAGLDKKEEKHETILQLLKKFEEKEKSIQIPEKSLNLIDNFHWEIARARRNKGLSQRQLGEAIDESESAIKMIERADLPGNYEKLIKKIEQFFQIRLSKKTSEEIRKEEAEERKREEEKSIEIELEPEELKELDFKENTLKKHTISELNKMLAGKIEEEKLTTEQAEEKRKRELKEKVTNEMIGRARATETIREKREMLNSALNKLNKRDMPTISELFDRKKEKEAELKDGEEVS